MEEDYGIDESSIPQTAENDPSVFDTLLLSDLTDFVSTAQSFLPQDDGIRLWVLVNRLPEVSGVLGRGCTMGRVIKYLDKTAKLFPTSLAGGLY